MAGKQLVVAAESSAALQMVVDDASLGVNWNRTRLVMHLLGMLGGFNMVLGRVGLLFDLLEGELLNGVIVLTRILSVTILHG